MRLGGAWHRFVLISLLFVGTFAHAEPIRDLELKIVEHLTGGDSVDRLSPIRRPDEPIETDMIFKTVKDSYALLEAHGVKTLPLPDAERAKLSNALQSHLKRGLIQLADSNFDPGTIPLLEITKLQALSHHKAMTAWQHPDTWALLDRLKRIGVRVFVDPTMGATGSAAIHFAGRKVIVVGPSITYDSLVHEAAHAELDHYRIREFIGRLKTARTAKDIAVLMKQSPYAGYGAERLRKVWELTERGYQDNTISEAMSIRSQLTILLESGGLATGSHRIHSSPLYLGRHLLHDTTEEVVNRALKPVERKWWIASLMAHQGAEPDDDLRTLIEDYLWQIRAKSQKEYQDIMQMLRTCRKEGFGILLDMKVPRDPRYEEFHSNVKEFVDSVESDMARRQQAEKLAKLYKSQAERKATVRAQRNVLARLISGDREDRDGAALLLRAMLPKLDPEVQQELVEALSSGGPEAALWRALYPEQRPAPGVAEAIAKLSHQPLRERLRQLARYHPLATPISRCDWRWILSAPWRLVTSR